ncbi:uncharacterized protein LOC112603085 [Melanaphis sacchari]|uniref:uncharacterized protein LOC112603085 n=1 Tax=Melanaphis sacchari TaxID=742174 RepID=UPI000DC148B5|nr:uncharacterized protein LOC112603085 [Melanaphis sacchari]
MAFNCKRIAKSEGCCRQDKQMMRCATTALKQMKDMFETAWCPVKEKSDKQLKGYNGCVIDPACNIKECPFRGTGVAPNVLQNYCTKSIEKTFGGQSDRDAMRLLPGEVGLRGDRATFSLVRGDCLGYDNYSTGGGEVYYNIRPNVNQFADDEEVIYVDSNDLQEQDQEQDQDRNQERDPEQDDKENDNQQVEELEEQPLSNERKHVMEVLPKSVKPKLGPVTGLPVSDDEHVFVLWLGKRPGEPDEKARLQIEVRVPKWVPDSEEETSETMLAEELPEVTTKPIKEKKASSSKKSGRSKKSRNSKKSGKNKQK